MVPQVNLRDDYSISRVIKGGWQLAGGHGQVDTQAAIADMFIFVENGITTFDCADIYLGVEEMIGVFLKHYTQKYGKQAAERVKIHTKFVPDLRLLAHIRRENIEAIIDRSLKRLGVEQLHLVQFHWWDYAIPNYVETALVLQDLQKKGKIRYLAGTNFDVYHVQEILSAGVQFVSLQVQYSVLDNRPEKQMIAFCQSQGISLLCYGTVAGGLLSERYLGKPEPQSPLENRSLTKYKFIIDDLGGWGYFQNLLRVLKEIADRHHTSIANVASRYVLERPHVTALVIGARNVSHIQDTVKVFDFSLEKQDYQKLQHVFRDASELEGDIYTLERQKEGKHAGIMKYNLNEVQAPL
jgi:aryl-alcohol dehydrogenase-like predicted oxidoreductase